MTKESILAKFALAPNVKLRELQPDSYEVMVKKSDGWGLDGDLTFHSDTLTRIAVNDYQSQEKDAGTLAKALYTAVADAEKFGPASVWTGRNEDANNPRYEVHLVFKDREVVIHTGVYGDVEVHMVTTYFPRLLRSNK
jgi:hypothetical protein